MHRKSRLVTFVAVAVFALALATGASAKGAGSVPLGGLALGQNVVYHAGSVVVGFTPTGADDIGDCLAGQFCLWDFQDFQGTRVFKTDNGWHDLTTFDNRAESAHNHTARDGKVATGYGGGGSQQCHAAGGHFNSLGSVFNNTVSSYALFASPVC
jgi:Peptidase inhibitor family I36